MKRFLFFLVIFVLVISAFSIMIHNDRYEVSDAEAVQKAFSVTGADAVTSEIYIRGKTAGGRLDDTDAVNLLTEIVTGSNEVNCSDIPAFSSIDTDTVIGKEINYIIDENKSVQMSILKGNLETEDKDMVFISFIDTSRNPDLIKNSDIVTNALKKYRIDFEMNIAVTGNIGKRLSETEIEEIFDRAFESAEAEKVEGINDNGLVSVSAFSPVISRTGGGNGKKANLNIAARYNSYENKTYIWLATPVIITEY